MSKKTILFVHQNFPGQFKHLAPELVRLGHDVRAMVVAKAGQQSPGHWQGVQVYPYTIQRSSSPSIHPWVTDFETKVIRGEAAYRAALELKAAGFSPDVIVAHPGWGESLFLRQVWPAAALGLYAEFYYRVDGADVGFDPEFSARKPDDAPRLQMKNLNNDVQFPLADGLLSPTHFQASTYPEALRSRITVVHDGIDTDQLRPDPTARARLRVSDGSPTGRSLRPEEEVITFVNRNLEPYRGYPTFMRCLPELLQRRPHARVFLVGGDGVSYGSAPAAGAPSWKQQMIEEVRPQLSPEVWGRIHFVGNLPYEAFVSLLQASTVHVYLTYPFVLSWSLLEAMSLGCAIVGSDTPPVREVIHHGQTGLLVDFFSPSALATAVSDLLDSPAQREGLAAAARQFAIDHYDLRRVCLGRQVDWVLGLEAKPDQN